MAKAQRDQCEGAAPEHGAPEHVQHDAVARHAQQRGYHRAPDGRKQHRREEGNAPHSEFAENLDDVARAPGEDGLAAQTALLLPVRHPGPAYAGEDEYAGHHAGYGEGERGPEMQAHGRAREWAAQKLHRTQQENGGVLNNNVMHGKEK